MFDLTGKAALVTGATGTVAPSAGGAGAPATVGFTADFGQGPQTVTLALGEFGAVLVVSSNLPGQSQTLTLLVHDRYLRGDDYGAYTISTVLMAVAVTVLIAQIVFDAQRKRTRTED